MKLRQFISSALLFIGLCGVTMGEVLEVPSSGMRTIGKAIIKAQPGDTILIGNGIYEEKFIAPSGVVLKAKNKHKAVVDGGGRGTVITMSRGSVIDGLKIKNGTIGVFSKAAAAEIKHCKIVQNWMTGIITVRNFPKIEDNLIAFNKGSGMVCWDSKGSTGEAAYNTIAYNGGFGLRMGGKSTIAFKNNVVAFNLKYGFKASDESAGSTVSANNFYENLKQLYEFPTGNYEFDPGFRSPKVLQDFRPLKGCCAVKSSSGQELGVRFTE